MMDLEKIRQIRDAQRTERQKNMKDTRLSGYLRAIEVGRVAEFHDYQDIHKGKMTRMQFRKKWKHDARNTRSAFYD